MCATLRSLSVPTTRMSRKPYLLEFDLHLAETRGFLREVLGQTDFSAEENERRLAIAAGKPTLATPATATAIAKVIHPE